MSKKQKKVLLRIIAAAVIALIALMPSLESVKMPLFFACYLIIGYDILIKAGKGVINRQPFDENFLMAIATVGAIALGDYAEGAMVMLFYQVGELFQSYAVGKSRRSIGALMDIRPDSANLETADGTIITVSPDEVEVGSIIVVRAGEKIPLDGVVIEGSSSLNTGALTGESLPRDVSEGDSVISGCINLSGLLRIRTEKEFGESTVSKILDLVENASSRKSRSENFISRFARVYTPAVCFAALALALLPPLAILALGGSPDWGDWLYRALTLLVISCPCALVISIPLGFFAGIGGASREGVLVKGSNYIEMLSKVDCLVFDKTGTLTEGSFSVSELHPVGVDESRLLELAAAAETYSTHPIAKSLRDAYGGDLSMHEPQNVTEVSGGGIRAVIDGMSVAVGNAKLMKESGIDCTEPNAVGTVVHVAADGKYLGCIVIADHVKDGAAAALAALKKAGIDRTVMLTGDSAAVGNAVASSLGIDKAYCELLPADKVAKVEELINEGARLAFVGDGINDAPVLSRADVGIAMGALGSDAAIEAADMVLMDDDPMKIVTAIRLSKKCMCIVYENIYFAIGVKLVCLVLGALGIANMWLAIFADVGVMVIAVLNAIRALKA